MKRIVTLVTAPALLVITLVVPARALDVGVTEHDPAFCASLVLMTVDTQKIQSGSSPKHSASYRPKSVVGKHTQPFATSKGIDLSGKSSQESCGTTSPGQVRSVIPKVPRKVY